MSLLASTEVDRLRAEDEHTWDAIHQRHWGNRFRKDESSSARSIERRIPRNSRILELGCGAGADAEYFSAHGHAVVALDFSTFAIQENCSLRPTSDVAYLHHNICEDLPFEDGGFDVVYSRLAIHYFLDDATRRIIREIARVLRRKGIFYFMCKSVDDPLYGKGVRIADDVFVYQEQQRHFFSVQYANDILTSQYDFELISARARKQGVYGQRSGIVQVLARRPGDFVQLRLFDLNYR